MPPNAFTIVMLPTTSASSPSTAAACEANSWCSCLPAAALRNIMTMTSAATTIRQAAISQLTVATSAIDQTVAMQGGRTFHTSMFSTVNNALEVAVTRDVRVPGGEEEK